MARFIGALLALSLLAMTKAQTLVCDGLNNINNGNFEDAGLYGSWRAGDDYDESTTYVQSAVKQEGRSALVMDFSSTSGGSSSVWAGPFFLFDDSAVSYKFSGYVLNQKGIQATITLSNGSGPVQTFEFKKPGASWQYFEYSFDPSIGPVSLSIEAQGGKAPVYFDNFLLQKCQKVNGSFKKRSADDDCYANLLNDPGFDSSNGAWGNVQSVACSKSGVSGTFGQTCALLSKSSPKVSQTISVDADTVYRLTGQVALSGGDPLTVRVISGDVTETQVYPDDYNVFKRQSFQVSFAASDSTAVIELASPSDAYVDYVSLTRATCTTSSDDAADGKPVRRSFDEL